MTLAWISDTQLYSESYPAVFDSMTGWLADNAGKGGVVISCTPATW